MGTLLLPPSTGVPEAAGPEASRASLALEKQESPAGHLDLASQGCLSPAVLCQAVPETPRSCRRPCVFQAASWADTSAPRETEGVLVSSC